MSDASPPDPAGNASAPPLLQRVSRSMFWNTTLLPLITVFNLAAAVLIRRYFGFDSGVYDVLIGVVNSLMFYASFGITVSLSQFVPSIEAAAGRPGVVAFLRRAFGLRLALLVVVLVPVVIWAPVIAARLDLGQLGPTLIRIACALAVLRAGNDLLVKALQSLLAHLSANLLLLLQAALVVVGLAVTLSRGAGMDAVMAALVGVAILVGGIGALQLARLLRRLPEKSRERTAGTFSPGLDTHRFARFSLFMYAYEWLSYFGTPAFTSPAIAIVAGSREPVALFNVGFQFPMMIVVLVLAGFQGLYRPLFARLFAEGDRDRLRTAFSEVSKVQAAMLIPAGVGLGLMVGDLIPLLFGAEFAAAVPLARVLCALLFAEAMLNLGVIMLSVDHKYRAVLWAQGLRLAVMPAFVWFAGQGQLVSAAAVFGAGRLAASLAGFLLARSEYGVRFPVAFVARAAVPSVAMLVVVAAARYVWPTSWAELVTLTAVGVVVVLVGMRVFRVLGPREIDLLERARLPAQSLIIGWLKPRS